MNKLHVIVFTLVALTTANSMAADPPIVKKLSDRPIDSKASEARIRATLQKTGDFQFDEKPLGEVLASLTKRFEIPIEVDSRALAGVGYSAETVVACDLKGATLTQTLRVLLRPLELTFKIQSEALLVTTPEEADGNMETRFYAVNNLVDSKSNNIEDLVIVVCTNIAPETWDRVGGPASLVPLELNGRMVLMCHQLDEYHQKEVADFLKRLAELLEE